jgi:hypothetical protein
MRNDLVPKFMASMVLDGAHDKLKGGKNNVG